MKRLLAIVLLLTAAQITGAKDKQYETGTILHITAVRNLAATDPAPVSRAFRVYMVVGTMGGFRYTAQQIFSWGSQHFEVGKDYEVLKSDPQSLTVLMHDKKGRETKERLDVVNTEETQSVH